MNPCQIFKWMNIKPLSSIIWLYVVHSVLFSIFIDFHQTIWLFPLPKNSAISWLCISINEQDITRASMHKTVACHMNILTLNFPPQFLVKIAPTNIVYLGAVITSISSYKTQDQSRVMWWLQFCVIWYMHKMTKELINSNNGRSRSWISNVTS